MDTRKRTVLFAAIALLALAIVLAPIIYLGSQWITLGGDAPAADYVAMYNDLARKSAGINTAGENNWPIVEAISEDFAAVDAAYGTPRQGMASPSVDFGTLLDPGADEADRAAALAALAELDRRGTWEKLDRLAENPAAAPFFLPGTDLFTASVPFASARQAARANAYHLRTALQQQQGDEVVLALVRGLTLARIAAQQPLIIMRLVGIAIEDHTRRTLRTQVLEQRPDEATLLRMIRALESHSLPPIALSFEGERIMGQQMLYTSLTASPLVPVNRRAQMARHADIVDTAIAYVGQPRQDRDPALAAQLNRAYNLGRRYSPVALIVPAFEKTILADDQNFADRHGTIVFLAVETFLARTGTPPESLEALVAVGILSAVPNDPFSADGFRYRTLDPASDPLGRAYILYSVGADGQDNGGTPAPQPHNAFTDRAPGTDFIFNTPSQ